MSVDASPSEYEPIDPVFDDRRGPRRVEPDERAHRLRAATFNDGLIDGRAQRGRGGPLSRSAECTEYLQGYRAGWNERDREIERADPLAATSPQELVASAEGRKDDTGKDPWHLLPTDAIRGVVQVLRHGAGEYGERNWEAGMAWSRVYDALLRHLTAWWEGEGKDPETGLSHLWHVACCALFLAAFELRGVGRDDRPAGMAREARP